MDYFLTAAYINKENNESDIFSKKVTGNSLKEVMALACDGAPGVFTWWTIVEVATGEIVARKSNHVGKTMVKRGAFPVQEYNVSKH